jgi:hypothetical protein
MGMGGFGPAISVKLEAKKVKKMNRLFIAISFVVVSTGQAKRE